MQVIKKNTLLDMQQYSEQRMSQEEVNLIYEHIYGNQVQTFQQGGMIYQQGEASADIYVVKCGAVELSTKQADKQIVIGVAQRGDLFGEVEAMTGDARMTCARCQSYTQVYVVNREKLLALLKQSHPLVKKINQSMCRQLKKACASLLERQLPGNPLISLAHLMTLLASAAGSQGVALQDVQRAAADINAFTASYVDQLLTQMKDLSLVEIRVDHGQTYILLGKQLLERTRKIVRSLGTVLQEKFKADYQALELSSAARMLGVEVPELYGKIRMGKIPASLMLLQRQGLLDLLHEQGVQYFRGSKLECELACEWIAEDLRLDELLELDAD